MKFNKFLRIILWTLMFLMWLFIWFVVGFVSCWDWHICL
jgi:hypothetical protein